MAVSKLDGRKMKVGRRRVMFSHYIMVSKDIMFICDKADIEAPACILNYQCSQWKTVNNYTTTHNVNSEEKVRWELCT